MQLPAAPALSALDPRRPRDARARALLIAAGGFAPGPIPLEPLFAAARRVRAALEPGRTLPRRPPSEQTLEAEDALDRLVGLALAIRLPERAAALPPDIHALIAPAADAATVALVASVLAEGPRASGPDPGWLPHLAHVWAALPPEAPERGPVALRWCNWLLLLGRAAEAREACERAAHGPEAPALALLRARALLALGDGHAAVAQARAVDPATCPDAWDVLANALFDAGDWPAALDAAQKAQAVIRARGRGTPDTARAELRTALLEAWLGRPELALPHARSALTLLERIYGAGNPDLLGAQVIYAQVTTLSGRPQDAIPLLQRALARTAEATPATAAARLALATALLRRGRADEAEQVITDLLPSLSGGAEASARHLLGQAAAAQGRQEAAQATLAEALRQRVARSGPQHPLSLLCQANLATAQGDRSTRQQALDALAAATSPRCPLLTSALP